MKPLGRCPTVSTKESQLLVQFGIRKKVQIRLVKLKEDVDNRVAKLKSESGNTKFMPIPCHNRRHITKKITKHFKCHLCNYLGAKLNDVKSHVRIHSDERLFKCTLCSYKGLTRHYLNKHILIHRGDKSYTCQFCANRFSIPSSKSTHEKRCRKNPKHSDAKWLEENKNHKCHLCKYSSWKATDLRVHLRGHFGQKPFACNLCTYKCTTNGNLNSHIFTHTREKPFKCLTCDYATAFASNLRSHTKCRHSNEVRNKNFSCNLCPLKFYSKSNLYTHIMSHTGETPFACQFCRRGFNVNRNKNLHEKTCQSNPKKKDKKWVEEQKVFKCELCQYSTIYKSQLGTHLQRHTENRTFHCSQCSYRSSCSSDLRYHSQRQHAEKTPFKCSHCYYGCVTSSILKRHISSHHSNIH